MRKPCSEEQGFPKFQDTIFAEIEAREIDGGDGTKVTRWTQDTGCSTDAFATGRPSEIR